MTRLNATFPRVSRRLLLQSTLAGAASAPLFPGMVSSFQASPSPVPSDATSLGGWRTWYLASPEELRPPAPGIPGQEEIDEVLQLQAGMTVADEERVMRWGRGLAVLPWAAIADELFAEFGIGSLPQARFYAYLHTAMSDAIIAARDAQEAYDRPGPAAADSGVTVMPGVVTSQASYPSEHAAVAGAASVVMMGLLPDVDPGRFDALAMEAAESRIMGGAAYRSDVQSGLELGRAIGERAAARAQEDGFAAQWDPSTKPTGPGIWEPTPPNFLDPALPMAGKRRPWVLSSADQFRPVPPPEYGSPTWESELRTVQEIAAHRTFEQERAAQWWGSQSPPILLNGWAKELVTRYGLEPLHASQFLSAMNVALDDVLIAVWDAKYTWWSSRPLQEDPDLVLVYPNPPYPAYPGGYGAAMGAGTTVIGHYFPQEADDYADRAWEGANSRAWAGIHYVIDNDTGLLMGRRVGRLVCALPGIDGPGTS